MIRDFCGLGADTLDAGRRKVFLHGMRDGIPIGLGYFAVAFTLGIYARNVGLTAVQATVSSLLTHASAGQYAGFSMIGRQAAMTEVVIMTLVINARYLLMSTALSQRFSPKTPFFHRLLIAFDVTDENFALAIMRPGYIDPAYIYGAYAVDLTGWAVGTALGIAAGNILPARVVSALSVAIYGMFIAIIIPPARKNRIVGVLVVLSFAASFAFAAMPLFSGLSAGTKTLILTIAISGGAAALFPVRGDMEAQDDA